jgi:hypothetical protein
MTSKLCKAGQQLRQQVDDSYPDRDKSSDGWIGDISLIKFRRSDHNPDAKGIVRAIDIDRDLFGKAKPDLMPYLADQIRVYAKRDKSKRISLYHLRRSELLPLAWGGAGASIRGVNPHDKHCHISFTKKGDTDGSFFNIPMIGGTDDKAKR